jgi:toxin CcdB
MAQFDVYRMAQSELVLDIQTDLLGKFESRIVVPLMPPEDAPLAHSRLNPPMIVENRPYVMVTQFMIAVRRADLHKPIANLTNRYDAIHSALDMIFVGF